MSVKNVASARVPRCAALVLFLGLVVGLAGCNTLHGVGQDMEKAGETIQRATR